MAVGVLLLSSALAWRSAAGGRGWPGPNLPLLGLGVLTAFTIPTALSPGLAAYTALRWLLAGGVYLALARSEVAVERLVIVFMAGLGIHVLVGLGQVLLQRPLGLPGELAVDPSRRGAAIITVGATRWLRAYGLTLHPNVLGGCLGSGLILGLPLLDRPRVRALWWLLCLGLLITFSRSAWLAVAVSSPLAVGWFLRYRPPMRRPMALALIGAALIAALSVAPLTGQLLARLQPFATPTEQRSIGERGVLQAVALDVIVTAPLTGVGAGNFPLAALAAETRFPPQPVHNLPLLLAAELGIIGACFWLWLWLAPGIALTPRLPHADPWAVATVSAWFALGVIGLWDSYPWALNAGRLLSAALLGVFSHAAGEWDSPPSNDRDGNHG